MYRYFFVFLGVFMMLSSTTAEARLPDNWRAAYQPGESWQIGCPGVDDSGTRTPGQCRQANVYFFNTDGDEPEADDIIFSMTYDMRRGWLAIAPYEGSCIGGVIKVDGENRVKLVKGLTGCEPDRGLPFYGKEYPNRDQSISTFADGSKMELILHLADGRQLTQEIPLAGFGQAYETMVERTNASGRGGARGRGR